ncbi:MAG: serine/threonine-protein kinase, partial [Myxococcota bacterium]|nr:serine/threonine-protein kinase [Myxococcota bacterium]
MFRELDLVEPIAKGGSSTVWLARHKHTGHPLAVKFLRREWASRAEVLLAEAEALSRLDHRHVATIYDMGVLSKPYALADEQFAAQTPYIVMEWADQGTSMMHRGRWERGHLKTVLEQTLGALSHIHARGLFHLDIKPSNVLLARDERLEYAEVRVVDMGLWSLRGEDGEAHFGTPGYMAPERRASVAADVYGVGMMALALAGEVLPREHDEDAIARMLSVFSPEWSAWLKCCVAREPESRFSSAVLAREALLMLEPSCLPLPLDVRAASLPEVDTTAYSTFIETQISAMSLSPKIDPLPIESPRREQGAQLPTFSEVPILPRTWRLPHPPRPIRRLAGVGGGVFAQRALRFVGQEDVRDKLWQLLIKSEDRGEASLVRVCGEQGSGRSTLAAWFGHRVAELSGGCFVEVSAVQGRRRLESCLDVIDALAASDVVFSEELTERARSLREAILGHATGGRVLAEEWQLFDVCRAYISAMASHGRLVLHLHGVSSSSSWESLIEALHASPIEARHGVVILATHVDAEVGDIFDAKVSLEPLPPQEIGAIVNQSLGLDPLVIDELARRSGGNPGYVRQMVLAWLQRGWLVPGPKGLMLGSWDEPWLSPEALALEPRITAWLEPSDADARRALAALVLV